MRYSDSHIWVHLEADIATVGTTDYGQRELGGEIVYVELPLVGQQINAGQEAAVLESTKAAIDIYSPISGKITAVNQMLKDHPDLINQSPEKKGWLFKIHPSNSSEMDLLLSAEDYQALLNGA